MPYEDKGSKRPTARSRELRLNATDAERKLWQSLSARRIAGVRFNRQFPIGPFICDFVSRSAKLIIEVDGGQHSDRVQGDASRTAYLEARGYRVIRFWNHEVLANIEGVVTAIESALSDSPSPNPVPGEQRPALFRPCRGQGRPGTRKREGCL